MSKIKIDFLQMIKTPTLEDEIKTAFHFAARAVSKDEDSMYGLQYVKVEPIRIMASNGHVLHISYVEHDIEPGFYSVHTISKSKLSLVKGSTNIEWPDASKIIATIDENSREYIGLVYTKAFPHIEYAKVIQSLPAGVSINYDYFLSCADIADEFSVDGEAMIHFRSSGGVFHAYVMPTRG